ncbi:UDP-glucose 4-epimerase [Magnetospirillum sp. LM-5]|uniref:NAD-dependent epimerase/dehydratase family protein n=1 Tax=Magnetospirillum sp. LM-5 TaxID=2681466 RepID=UPI001384A705|nr:NAD-dependent epimerase/dehydratase family protein [Magnetospirillum sp. LM-5]CAA7622643.1 UDP-glucose 4-epimerase [Magnetospirillum sp. LM-5]
MKILVTGASGFVGGPVCRALMARGHRVVAASRRDLPGLEVVPIGELGPDTDWRPALDGVEAVVHLAARAHVMQETETDPLALFRRINRDATLALARQAAAAGVQHLLFVSSIKVNGEATPPDRPYRADDAPAPLDAYGIAKAEAEQGLRAMDGPMALTILRPPLIHGPGAKGNLATLLKVLNTGLPLPLGGLTNRRSLVGIDNLADALAFLLERRAGGTFLIRDGEDVSTSQLLRLLGDGLGRPARLMPLPAFLFRLLGRSGTIRRLTGSLVVDDSPLRALGWTPPLSLKDGLARMTSAWRNAR